MKTCPLAGYFKQWLKEAAHQVKYHVENYLISLKVLAASPHLSPILWINEKQSATVDYQLKEEKYDAVHFALEGGLAYYSLPLGLPTECCCAISQGQS